jgi:hypothetical protein
MDPTGRTRYTAQGYGGGRYEDLYYETSAYRR